MLSSVLRCNTPRRDCETVLNRLGDCRGKPFLRQAFYRYKNTYAAMSRASGIIRRRTGLREPVRNSEARLALRIQCDLPMACCWSYTTSNHVDLPHLSSRFRNASFRKWGQGFLEFPDVVHIVYLADKIHVDVLRRVPLDPLPACACLSQFGTVR